MRKQRGFVLIIAIFILIVITGAVALLGTMISNQAKESAYNIMRTQAHYAAESGLAVAQYKAVYTSWCASDVSDHVIDFSGHAGILGTYSVTLSCIRTTHNEDGAFDNYLLTAVAERGNYGTFTYSRKAISTLATNFSG